MCRHWHTVWDKMFYIENGPVNVFFIANHEILILQLSTRFWTKSLKDLEFVHKPH